MSVKGQFCGRTIHIDKGANINEENIAEIKR